jgi:hypothetical protein
MDEHDLLPGQQWESAIDLAIRSAAAVVLFLSTKSVSKKGFVQKEVRAALDAADHMPDGAVFIVPVRLENCLLPDRLSRWHAIDLCSRGGYAKLIASLRKHAPDAIVREDVQAPERLPRFPDATEHLLFEEFVRSGRLLYHRLARNRYAFSQGHFLVLRKTFPPELVARSRHAV